uniref:YicC family protein n=1 Tax=Desulfomonile tiedjei TaxID=2358 RepID=A0A7C4AT38_9BACT
METTEHSKEPSNINSMTGYGRGRRAQDHVEIVAEVRSVNHRFLDVAIKVPKFYACFEPDIRRIVSERIHRGKIDVTINRLGEKTGLVDVVVDYELARCYLQCLEGLRDAFKLPGPISLSDLINFKDVVTPVDKNEGIEQEWPLLESSLREALEELDVMRRKEGAAMWKDIVERLRTLHEKANLISPLVDQVVKSVRDRLEKKIRELTNGIALDDDRLIQEVAFFAERSDVTEELTRLESHLEQFVSSGNSGSPVGRKLDFLLQELQREINTLGSKSASTDIARHVVDMKAELEKIREQTQNIE